MKSGCNSIKWALLPILDYRIYKITILFVSDIKNLGSILTYRKEYNKIDGSNSGVSP